MIKFLDLKEINDGLSREIEAAALRVLRSGWYIGGNELQTFEDQLSCYLGAGQVVGVSNGLDALRLIFRSYLELGRLNVGDEIVVPSNTFIASALAVSDSGLRVVLVDPDPNTHNINAMGVRSAITPRTRAVLLVHLYGRNAYTDEIQELADSHGLLLIEDNAQALGASHRGRKVGTLGNASAMSFYPGKNLGALGDAGAVASADPDVIATVRSLRNYGSSVKYRHEHKGYNNRLDEIQAAMLAAKLPFLDIENQRRREIAAAYDTRISNPHISLPQIPSDSLEHVWHLYVIRSQHRNSLIEHLSAHSIESIIHYPIPIHLQAAYSELSTQPLPVAESLASEVLSIPIGSHLDDNDVDTIVDALNRFDPRK
ncbi:MAG: DegT/DnrJ/EryC1/StrS family aminotransferase [Candidatus Kapabacteria bacterium]|nr:DegT/DnrJ/EryC1/StrS family aminotransferase [Candidatus Kapabacteria bacterium]